MFNGLRRWAGSVWILGAVSLAGMSGRPVRALSGGPEASDSGAAAPAGDMVDLFTGDLKYSVPLLDVGGYGVTLAYRGDIGPDEEASWVGLGWSLGPGSVARSVRGLPDDLRGEEDPIVRVDHMVENQTRGLSLGTALEVLGQNLEVSANVGWYNNTLRGRGVRFEMSPALSWGSVNKSRKTAGLGLQTDSQGGVALTPSFSLQQRRSGSAGPFAAAEGVSVPITSTDGLRAVGFGVGTRLLGKTWGHSPVTAFGFGMPSQLPDPDLPFRSVGATFNVAFGWGGAVLSGARLRGWYNKQWIAEETRSFPAFGYLYAHAVNDVAAAVARGAMLDFQREKDQGFSKELPHLPLATMTYDTYVATGPGVGASFRPHRGDVPIVYDPDVASGGGGGSPGPGKGLFKKKKKGGSKGADVSLGLEFGWLPGLHVGIDGNAMFTRGESGLWRDTLGYSADAAPGQTALGGFASTSSEPSYEPVWFSATSERTAETDPDQWSAWGGDDATRLVLEDGQLDAIPSNPQWTTGEGDTGEVDGGHLTRQVRAERQQVFTWLSAEDAARLSLPLGGDAPGLHDLLSFPAGEFVYDDGRYSGATRISRADGPRQGHHISEITITQPDGTRLVYGIPVYNSEQREHTFSVDEGNASGALVTYTDAEDSTSNTSGRLHLFRSVETPAYATAWLLTAVLSMDYADQTGDGPTPDDRGTWTRFNYTRTQESYGWRSPYGDHQASFEEGYRSDDFDGLGAYVYGVKEIWTPHSIETPTHLAEFEVGTREDALGVKGPEGGEDKEATLVYLKAIRLYTRAAKEAHGVDAVPLQTVHFAYSYALEPDVPNSEEGGRLTLDRVWSTFRGGEGGPRETYRFSYALQDGESDPACNPSYAENATDRWGMYRDPDVDLPPWEAPWGDDDEPDCPAPWALSRIELPSGGSIDIDYESDTYREVQDRRAMHMTPILGLGQDPDSDRPDRSPDLDLVERDHQVNTVAYFKLAEPIPTSTADPTAAMREQYLCRGGPLLFRFRTQVGTRSDQVEDVSGWADVASADEIGVLPVAEAGTWSYGWVRLADVPREDAEGDSDRAHPVSKAAWQLIRRDLPALAFEGAMGRDYTVPQKASIKDAYAEAIGQVKLFLGGFNRQLEKMGMGTRFVEDHAWIRLCSPRARRGGGSRVRSLSVHDRAEDLGVGADATVRQVFDYTLEDGSSAGVASWEPMVGGEENPFRAPAVVRDRNLLVPDETRVVDLPMGESLTPAPVVGYSRVTVRTTHGDGTADTGREVHLFYTASDFPIRFKDTQLDHVGSTTGGKLARALLKLAVRDHWTGSEGYLVERNDMHGRPRATWVYSEADPDTPRSGVEYRYRTTVRDGAVALDSRVPVIDRQGALVETDLGVSRDLTIDLREARNTMWSAGIGGNAGTIASFFGWWATVVPSMSSERTQLRSAVITKEIDRAGLLEEVVTYRSGGRVAAADLIYDGVTGATLVTRQDTGWRAPGDEERATPGSAIYHVSVPARLAYDRMGPASWNVDRVSAPFSFSQGVATLSKADRFFVPGDEVDLGASGRGWVLSATAGTLKVVDEDGAPITGTHTLRVLRSGRRNLAGAPIANVTTSQRPTGEDLASLATDILDAGATQYAEDWAIPCGRTTAEEPDRIVEAGPYWYARTLNDMTSSDYPNNGAPAGDLNQDGYGDVILWHLVEKDGRGMVALAYGSGIGAGPPIGWPVDVVVSTSANNVITLPAFDANLPFDKTTITKTESKIANADGVGDVNGDGYDDIIIDWQWKAWHEGTTSTLRWALIYAGDEAGLQGRPIWIHSISKTYSSAGDAQGYIDQAGVGDVDGDGYDDVAIFGSGETFSLYLGASDGPEVRPVWTVTTTRQGTANVSNAWALSSAGDVNADGLADLVVGWPGWTHGQQAEGMITLYLGTRMLRRLAASNGGTLSIDDAGAWLGGRTGQTIETPGAPPGAMGLAWRTESNQTAGMLGARVGQAGDLNGDGFDDFYARSGAPFTTIFAGGAGGPSQLTVFQGIVPPTDSLGTPRFAVGDVNGDELEDLTMRRGRCPVIVLGDRAGSFTERDLGLCYLNGARSFTSPNFAGDVNGDGRSDLLINYSDVGSPGQNWVMSDLNSDGRADVMFGSLSTQGTPISRDPQDAAAIVMAYSAPERSSCEPAPGDTVNPYRAGLAGDWRPSASWVYRTNRRDDGADLVTRGVYETFTPFWSEGDSALEATPDASWVRAQRVRSYSRTGAPVEVTDALDHYRSYLYNDGLWLVAEASDAAAHDLIVTTFEERSASCETSWAGFAESALSDAQAHTGEWSLAVPARRTVEGDAIGSAPEEVRGSPFPCVLGSGRCADAGPPDPGRYILSYWAKPGQRSCDPPEVSVVVDSGSVETALSPGSSQPMLEVDGWWRVEEVLELPTADAIQVQAKNPDCAATGYIDDLRIQPYGSELVVHALDPEMDQERATLDNQNFATVYRYDVTGALVSVMAETERGWRTLTETRSHRPTSADQSGASAGSPGGASF